MSKQFCVHGHDTYVCGRRAKNSECRECKRIRSRVYQRGKTRPYVSKAAARVPAAPLVEAMSNLNLYDFDQNFQRRYYRVKHMDTITVHTADEMACRIGRHPYELWGEEFYTGLKDVS